VRVLHVASELHPLVKTGGLADVAAGLPAALRRAGLDVRVLVPGYPGVRAAAADAEVVLEDPDLFGGGEARVLRCRLRDVAVDGYVLDQPARFDRPGNPYVDADGHDYPDNAARFSALAWAATRLAEGADPAFAVDVLHGHDWQAGLAIARAQLSLPAHATPALVFTIHNIGYQGVFGLDVAPMLDLPAAAFGIDGLEFHGQISFLKAGVIYADRITTVSRTYAREIMTESHGYGLDGLLRHRADALVGIVNGVDYDTWNPTTDAALPVRFDASHLGRREVVARGLRSRFALAAGTGPLFGVVSRLVYDKGLDLLADVVDELHGYGAQLVVLGAGDPALEARFRGLAEAHRGRVGVHIGFDEGLAHRVFGGADAVIVPSRHEPCGLTQLYALRYGAVPIVRNTGGLADTVTNVTGKTLADGTATGFVFDDASAPALSEAIERACATFGMSAVWRSLQHQGMARDFGWDRTASHYVDVYRDALAARGR
jgi:starch synthase